MYREISESYEALEDLLVKEYFLFEEKYLVWWYFSLEHPEILNIRQIGFPHDSYLRVVSA